MPVSMWDRNRVENADNGWYDRTPRATAPSISVTPPKTPQQAIQQSVRPVQAGPTIAAAEAAKKGQTFLPDTRLSATPQSAGFRDISFNAPGSGLPLVDIGNDPRIEAGNDSPWWQVGAALFNHTITPAFHAIKSIGEAFGDVIDRAVVNQVKKTGVEANVSALPVVQERRKAGKSDAPTGVEIAADVLNAGVSTVMATPAFAVPSAGMALVDTVTRGTVANIPSQIVNKVFQTIDSTGRAAADYAMDNIPMEETTRQILRKPVEDIAATLFTLGVFKIGHKVGETGGGRAIDALPIPEVTKGPIKTGISIGVSATMDPLGSAFRLFNSRVAARAKAVADATGTVTPDQAKRIVSEVAKGTEIPNDNGSITIPTSAGDVVLQTAQKTVLTNLIKGREDIAYRVVPDLGKNPDGTPIVSQFVWDANKRQSTILTTDKATAVNIAHELGHFVDHQLGYTLSRRLSEVMPEYSQNRDQMNQLVADYALSNLGGNGTKAQIDAEIVRVAESLTKEMKVVASGEAKKAIQERMASSFSRVMSNPEIRTIAPELSNLVEFTNLQTPTVAPSTRGEILGELNKTSRDIRKEGKNNPEFQAMQAYENAKKEGVAAKEAVVADTPWKEIIAAMKKTPEFKKEGQISDKLINGTLMERDGKVILVPIDKVAKYAAEGYTTRMTMDEYANAAGFESAENYMTYITELSAEMRSINRSPVQKQLHEFLMKNDPNYANLEARRESLRAELIAEETARVSNDRPGARSDAGVPATEAGAGGTNAGSVAGEAVGGGGEVKPTVRGTNEFAPAEGPKKIAGRALSIERSAIENKLVGEFGDLPEYRTANFKDQTKRAMDLLESDPELAKRVAMGTELPPAGLIPEVMNRVFQERAEKAGDAQTLLELATGSALNSEASYMGQRISFLRNQNPDSAVSKIREIALARENRVNRQSNGRTIDEMKTEIAGEIRKNITKPKAKDWSEFIDSIQCK